MLRRLAKTGLAATLHWSQADRAVGSLLGPKFLPLVIGYHMVVENMAEHAEISIPASRITRTMLERHLDWLGGRYDFISLGEMAERIESGRLFDRPTAVITFDDGYENVYHHAFPLLKRKGIPAGFFLVTDLVGTRRMQIYDKLYLLLAKGFQAWPDARAELARLLQACGLALPSSDELSALVHDPYAAMRALYTAYPKEQIEQLIETLESQFQVDEAAHAAFHPMNWDMVLEMHRAGMNIGSHTKTHVLLTNESWQTVLDEMVESKRDLEWTVGMPVHHFSYPDGRFNRTLVSSAADAGYRFAYSCCLHRDPRYPLLTIPRKFLWENSCLNSLNRFSSCIMSCQVNWVFELFIRCQEDHGWSTKSTGRKAESPALTL